MEGLGAIVQVSALLFVLSSMLAMGLSLTVPEITAPLKNTRLVPAEMQDRKDQQQMRRNR